MERRQPYSRTDSRQVDLEESRKRHDMFRSSIFSSSIKGDLVPEITQGASGELDRVRESRIDAAIRAARAQDAQRGHTSFTPFPMPSTLSSNGSTFRNTGGHNSHASHTQGAQPPAHHQLSNMPNSDFGTGSSIVDSDSAGQNGGGTNAKRKFEYKDDPQQMPPAESVASTPLYPGTRTNDSVTPTVLYTGPRINMSVSSDQVDGTSVGGNGSKGGGRNGFVERSVWERAGGVATARAVTHGYASVGGVVTGIGTGTGTGSETPVGISAAKDWRLVNRKEVQPAMNVAHVDEKPNPAPDAESATDTRRQTYDVTPIDDRRSESEVELNGLELTPSTEEEPLELPDGSQQISLAKFLEVMTGPGLRVRKHHRAGKGSSGLRVLRYSEEDDSLVWDSHKILGAAQHVLPLSDVEDISRQPGNRVVLTCVGGKDSYAVFEAAKDEAAAVLFVGLERLRERSAARTSS